MAEISDLFLLFAFIIITYLHHAWCRQNLVLFILEVILIFRFSFSKYIFSLLKKERQEMGRWRKEEWRVVKGTRWRIQTWAICSKDYSLCVWGDCSSHCTSDHLYLDSTLHCLSWKSCFVLNQNVCGQVSSDDRQFSGLVFTESMQASW